MPATIFSIVGFFPCLVHGREGQLGAPHLPHLAGLQPNGRRLPYTCREREWRVWCELRAGLCRRVRMRRCRQGKQTRRYHSRREDDGNKRVTHEPMHHAPTNKQTNKQTNKDTHTRVPPPPETQDPHECPPPRSKTKGRTHPCGSRAWGRRACARPGRRPSSAGKSRPRGPT